MGGFFPFSGSQWSSGLFGYQHCSRYLLLDSIERKSFLGELSLNGCNFQQFNHSLVCHIVTKVMFTNFWLGTAYVFNHDEQRCVSFSQKRGDCSRVTEQCWGCVTIRSSARELSHCCQWTVCSYTHKQSSVLQAQPKHTQTRSWFSTASVLLFWRTLFSFCLPSFLFIPPRLF